MSKDQDTNQDIGECQRGLGGKGGFGGGGRRCGVGRGGGLVQETMRGRLGCNQFR